MSKKTTQLILDIFLVFVISWLLANVTYEIIMIAMRGT